VLCAALTLCAPVAMAADKKEKAPAPAKPPVRVPFSAFRTKPILDMHSDGPFKDTKDKKPISIRIEPMKIVPRPKPEEIANAPEEVQGADETTQDTAAVFAGNIPLPVRKPGTSTPDEVIFMPATARVERAPFVDNRQTPPEEEPTPQVAAEEAAQEHAATGVYIEEPDVPMRKPAPAMQIDDLAEDDESRFDEEDDRTAGAGFGIRRDEALSIASIGARNLRAMLEPDPTGAISPVLLPGYEETVAAPDAQGDDEHGIPAQVIVFFVEGSPRMEVGQIDIVNADVLERLKRRPDLDLEIVGFSEKLGGGAEETRKMSALRAAELRDYLKNHKIDTDRLTVTAKGDDTDVEPRDRVEMHFTE